MKLGKDIRLDNWWSNPYDFLTAVVQHCSLDQCILKSESCTLEQDDLDNPEIVYQHFKSHYKTIFFDLTSKIYSQAKITRLCSLS